MMKSPRVRTVLKVAQTDGVEGLNRYFSQQGMVVDPSTWSGKIQRLLQDNKQASVMLEINMMLDKLNGYING
jgi:hypothetical protein